MEDFETEEINHVLGFKNEEIRLFPDQDSGFEKDSRKHLNKMQQRDLIEENWGETASNFAKKSDISGTHYEKHNKAEIAMMMPKGL